MERLWQAVREQIAPWGSLPEAPEGHDRRGPEWLRLAVESYVEHAYESAVGATEPKWVRDDEIWLARRTTLTLGDIETWADMLADDFWKARSLAFLAGEWLGRHAGERALLDYYRQLPAAKSWEEAFASAFGLAVEDIHEAFSAYRADVAPPYEFRHVRGVVLDPAGHPAAGAWVAADRREGRWEDTAVTAGGRGLRPRDPRRRLLPLRRPLDPGVRDSRRSPAALRGRHRGRRRGPRGGGDPASGGIVLRGAMTTPRAPAGRRPPGALVAAVALAAALATAPGGGAAAAPVETIVEVRVWQLLTDEANIWVSARARGGEWRTLGTIPFPLEEGGYPDPRYRRGDLAVSGAALRLWRVRGEPGRVFACAGACEAPRRMHTLPLGMAELLLDDGLSPGGWYRYGDITIASSPDHPELERDRARLLRVAETLAGEGPLNWRIGTPSRSGRASPSGGRPRA